MPAVTIVIPTRDRTGELRQALDSVWTQAFTDWEALVIDDASTENVRGLVDQYADKRIRYLKLPPGRSGAPAGRNLGVEQSSGDFVLFLDSDDLIAPKCLERRLEIMRRRPELDFAVFQCSPFVNAPGDLPFTWNTFTGRPGESDLDRFLSRDNVWQTTAPIWRRAALRKFAPWNEQVPSAQDWEFHTRALVAGLQYEKFDEVDCYWRRPSEARDSIGKQTFQPGISAAHARARPPMLDSVRQALESAGLMTPARRRMFVGMYWEATRRLAERASFAEARQLWRDLRRRRLVGAVDFVFGRLFLLTGRSAGWTAWVTSLHDRRWDAVQVIRRRPEYLLHRLNDAPPVVSVLMVVRNQWRTVEAAIRSLLSQQLQDFELIVIDDGSTDRSGEIARRLAEQDARIRVLRRDRPNLAKALAEGLSAARGQLVARAAAEGTSRFHRLFEQVRYLQEHPNCVLVGGATSMRNRRHEEVRRFSPATDVAALRSELAGHTSTALPWETATMRRSAIDAAGGYRTGTGGPEAADLDLFQRLAGVGDVSNLDSVLVWLPEPLTLGGSR